MANAPVTLTSYLEAHSQSQYTDIDEGWKQWVMDYRSIIYQAAPVYALSGSAFLQSRYDIRRWLRTINAAEDAYWIVLIINQIPSDIQFYDGNLPRSIRVPTTTQLAQYHAQYLNSAASAAMFG